MPARTPEELDRLFSQALNAGDLDALVALYEPGAAFNSEPGGPVVTGAEAIREALGGFLALKPTMAIEVRNLGQSGDLAFTSGRWSLTGTDPEGNSVNLGGQSAEVCRRQPDGTWLFAIDLPFGTDWGA